MRDVDYATFEARELARLREHDPTLLDDFNRMYAMPKCPERDAIKRDLYKRLYTYNLRLPS